MEKDTISFPLNLSTDSDPPHSLPLKIIISPPSSSSHSTPPPFHPEVSPSSSSQLSDGFFLPLDLMYQLTKIEPILYNRFMRLNRGFYDTYSRYLSQLRTLPIGAHETFRYLKRHYYDLNKSGIRFIRYHPVEEFVLHLTINQVGPPFVRMSRQSRESLIEKFYRVTYQEGYLQWLEKIRRENFVMDLKHTHSILASRTSLMRQDPTYALTITFQLYEQRFASLRKIYEETGDNEISVGVNLLIDDFFTVLDENVSFEHSSYKRYHELHWQTATNLPDIPNGREKSLQIQFLLQPFIKELVSTKIKNLQDSINGYDYLPQPDRSDVRGSPGAL